MSQHHVPGLIVPFFNESRFQELKQELQQLLSEEDAVHAATATSGMGQVITSYSRMMEIKAEMVELLLPPDGPDCLHSGFGI